MASTVILYPQQSLNFKSLEKMETEFCNEEMIVRLIHLWEARNFKKDNLVMGVELLLIDSESNTAQGFIPASRVPFYENDLKANSLYKLKKFMLKPGKTLYRVADHRYNIIFTPQTSMVGIPEGNHHIDKQKFRIRSIADLSAIVDTNRDLFDVVGKIRLVTGDNLTSTTTQATTLAVESSRTKDRVYLHLFMKACLSHEKRD